MKMPCVHNKIHYAVVVVFEFDAAAAFRKLRDPNVDDDRRFDRRSYTVHGPTSTPHRNSAHAVDLLRQVISCRELML